ncbi:hypothetical protein N7470_000983 [Penicillium chermesinum]|nr:hypothetical protein N7470_000983 [Penicillium chermesinum]
MARTKHGVFSWEDVLAQRYQSNKPPPLPRSGRRTRSDPQPQPQCGLLSRLSPELRLIIWEMALGGRRIHIIQRNQRLGHIVCPLRETMPSSAKIKTQQGARNPFCEICNGGGIPQPVKEGDLINANNGDMLLGLALTCRQIYNESIHLLYTLTTFEFSNPWSLPYLRPTIPTDHWASIRSVELRWSFPGHWLPSKDPVRTIYVSAGRAQWLETCASLSHLPGLRSFTFILGSTWFSEPIEKLPVFLDPLRALTLPPHSEPADHGKGPRYASSGSSSSGSASSDEDCGSLSSSSLSMVLHPRERGHDLPCARAGPPMRGSQSMRMRRAYRVPRKEGVLRHGICGCRVCRTTRRRWGG